jgi:hypothetical protein
MTLDEKLAKAWDDGVAAERGRIRQTLEELHQQHGAELLERDRWRILRGGTLDLDIKAHALRGALSVLDRLLASMSPKDSGAEITKAFLDEQLGPVRRPRATPR